MKKQCRGADCLKRGEGEGGLGQFADLKESLERKKGGWWCF